MKTPMKKKQQPKNKKMGPAKPNLCKTNIGYFKKDESIVSLYVGNLHYSQKNHDIKNLFNKFGEVTFVKLVVDHKSQRSKGIAFVQMTDSTDASKAIKSLNGSIMNGRTLKVSIAAKKRNKGSRPKRDKNKI